MRIELNTTVFENNYKLKLRHKHKHTHMHIHIYTDKNNIETENYCIKADKITFYPCFSEPLEPYNKLMKYMTIVIFSDLTQDLERVESRFSQSNCLFSKNTREIHFGFWFNKCFEVGKGIERLYFSARYDSIVPMGKHLKHLVLGHTFNQPIQLSKNLKYLVVGICFNKPLVFPKRILDIEFTYCAFELPVYTHHLIFPSNIRTLWFPCKIVQPVEVPESLDELHVDSYCYNIVDGVGYSVKKLVYHNIYVSRSKCICPWKTLEVRFI